MISVPSHRLRLSGSKYPFVLLALLLVVCFSACGKKNYPTSVPDFSEKEVEEPPVEVVEEEVIPNEVEVGAQEPQEQEGPKKRYYNLAVLLPFNVQYNQLNIMNDSIAPKSNTAVEFYSGVQIALDELSAEGVYFNVDIYDTRNNKERIEAIVESLEVAKPDIIIGPVYNKHLSAVAEFALEHKIFVVSPLAPASSNIYKNPYYIAMNPGVPSHLEKIYNNMLGKFRNSTVTLISNYTEKDLALARKFMALNEIWYSDQSRLNIKHLTYSPAWDEQEKNPATGKEEDPFLLSQFSAEVLTNPVVVTSLDEQFANKILGHLTAISDTFNFTVYGMPNWPKFNSLDFDQLDKVNFHYTSAFFKNPLDSAQNTFGRKYRAKFHTLPSDIAARGFDVTYYLAQTLDEHGEKFHEKWDELNPKSIFSEYNFGPGYNKGSQMDINRPDFIENKFLYLIEFDNLNFQLAR